MKLPVKLKTGTIKEYNRNTFLTILLKISIRIIIIILFFYSAYRIIPNLYYGYNVKEINKILKTKEESEQELQRPYLIVQIASFNLLLDNEGRSRLLYTLINNGKMPAYNIRKGHRIFNEKKECAKHFYDTTDQYLLDLAPGEKSPIHNDNLEKLSIKGNGLGEKFFELQLIITYTKSKDENDTLYYSLVNLVLKPINCREGYCNEFIITRPSTKIGSIDKFNDECKEFNGK